MLMEELEGKWAVQYSCGSCLNTAQHVIRRLQSFDRMYSNVSPWIMNICKIWIWLDELDNLSAQ
uniref:Uncharacterized protein n=1 Tax=Onchocerca volvulus TaxID=6282 RepID=A0A8R1TKJ6_ONCVO